MTARFLLDHLRDHGARVWSQGGRVELDAPANLLTPELLAEVKIAKGEILQLLDSEVESSQPTQVPSCPADQLEADWQHSLTTADQRFGEIGVQPDQTTLEAAAWLHLQLEQGRFPRPGISEATARQLLESVYSGRLAARIKDGDRVVLREPQ